MKYFVFLMLAVCVGCSGQDKNGTFASGPSGPCMRSTQDFTTGIGDKFYCSGCLPNTAIPDRFANCVTFEGIHYCPEGRYIQVQDDAKRPDPYGICAAYAMLDGCKVPDFKQDQSIVCPYYSYCGTTAPIHPGDTIATPFGSELDKNTHIPNDNSHLDLNSCPVDALGSFNCPPVSPTTKKAAKAPSCSLWLLRSSVGDTMYCGEREATLEEIANAEFLKPVYIFQYGDKDIPKHKETNPSVREFYPPDPDKGPRILKASLRIQ